MTRHIMHAAMVQTTNHQFQLRFLKIRRENQNKMLGYSWIASPNSSLPVTVKTPKKRKIVSSAIFANICAEARMVVLDASEIF